MDRKRKLPASFSCSSLSSSMKFSRKLSRSRSIHDELRDDVANAGNSAKNHPFAAPARRGSNSHNVLLTGSENQAFPPARRCISDTNLWRARPEFTADTSNHNFSVSRLNGYRQKATILMAHRSNARGVQELLSCIERKCAQASPSQQDVKDCEYLSSNKSVSLCVQSEAAKPEIPTQECALISHVANDAFYKVIIGSSNGIATLIQAMKAFPQEASLQESGCVALGNLCDRNRSNLMTVYKENGIHAIVAAMRTHPQSIAVQSSACEALRNMSGLVIPEQVATKNEAAVGIPSTEQSSLPRLPSTTTSLPSLPTVEKRIVTELVELLENASTMYITPSSKQSAGELLSLLQKAITNC